MPSERVLRAFDFDKVLSCRFETAEPGGGWSTDSVLLVSIGRNSTKQLVLRYSVPAILRDCGLKSSFVCLSLAKLDEVKPTVRVILIQQRRKHQVCFGSCVSWCLCWVKTGDDSYNSLTTQGLLYQIGDNNNNILPANQTKTEGNDDQGIWALAAIAAAESGFPSPSKDEPQWQDLAVNVFNDLVQRWDTKTCDGGLRWQIFTFSAGYDFKNSASKGVFFDLAARLFLQTKNTTYSDRATKIFSWEQDAGLITDSYQVLEGVSTENCNNIDKTQTSLSASLFLHGSAALYNATTSNDWKTRVDGLLKGVQGTFVSNGVLAEVSCETPKTCSTDLQAFKSFLVRSLGETVQLAPYTSEAIQPLLLTNAKAAAKACSGSPSKGFAGQAGTACGFSWTGANSTFDGLTGVGEQMNALSAAVLTLTQNAKGQTNGTSPGKPSGTSPSGPAATTPKNAGSRAVADGSLSQQICRGSLLYAYSSILL